MKRETIKKDAKIIQGSLERIHRQLISRVLSELSRNKLTLGEYNLLSVLLDEGVCTMTQAACCLYVTTSAVTAMANKLTGKRMISRKRSRRDRRIVEIAVTDEGRKVTAKIRRQIEDFYIPILKSLGEKNRRELIRLQEKMCQIIGCSGK